MSIHSFGITKALLLPSTGAHVYDRIYVKVVFYVSAMGLVFHANKEPKYQYKFHHSILSDQINLLLLKITKLETEAKKMSSLLMMRKFDDKVWTIISGFCRASAGSVTFICGKRLTVTMTLYRWPWVDL